MRSRTGTDATGLLWRADLEVGDEHAGRAVTERLALDPRQLLAETESLDEAERARRERLRESGSGVTAFSLDDTARHAVLALGGRILLVDLEIADAALGTRQLTAPVPAVDPRLSPDGAWVAFHHAGRLLAVPTDGGEADELAGAGEAGVGVTWGLADFVSAEELDRIRAFWWAPDSSGLLVTRVDESSVPRWFIGDPARPEEAPKQVRYPAAGAPNATTGLAFCGTDGRHVEVAWDRERFEYLVDVRWSADGPALLTVLDRAQQHAQVLAWEPGRQPSVVRELRDEAFVERRPGTPRWWDGALVTIEADHAGDTYRLCVDGRPLSPVGMQVHGVLGALDGSLVLQVSEDPRGRRVVALAPGGALTVLDDSLDGVNTAVAAGGTVVLRQEAPASPLPRVTVRRFTPEHEVPSWEGELRCEAEDVGLELRIGHVDRDDGPGSREPRVAVVLPSWWTEADAALPVLLSPYGGPHGQRVVHAGRAFAESQWLAEQGFAVVVADGPGTPGPPAWERTIRLDLGPPALQAQIRALELAAEDNPGALDLARVGIRGWSFGGYLAALAVLVRPDLFHAAVAGAPVTEWRLYDTAYTERYLGLPSEHPSAYDRNSLLPLAPNLQRPLLLVHGLVDDNVLAAHTLRLSAALLAAGRRHQVLPLSGITHMSAGRADVAEQLLRLEVAFLTEALG